VGESILKYRITEIPDPFDVKHQMAAKGNVLAAVGKDFEHLLRAVANMHTGAVSVTVRFLFKPRPSPMNMQSRLELYLLARSCDPDTTEVLRLLIEHGPFSRFYSPETVQSFEAPWHDLQAACAVVRREDAVDPLHSAEYNPQIPQYYYTIRSFEPNDLNDYLVLLKVLGDIQEVVIIDICIEPTDVSAELWNYTRNLSQLQSINRTWGGDEDEEPRIQDYFTDDTNWQSNYRHGLIRPLRYKDPLADEILRSQQRFHETLRQPHLLFHVISLAKTSAVAQLLASVVAESAFEQGSYRLLPCSKKDAWLDEGLRTIRELRVSTLPAHNYIFQDRDVDLYKDLRRLSHVATVDELTGVFRFPVGSITSPKPIRMNTDPPNQVGGQFITIGFDMDLSGMRRWAILEHLVKHLFISGVTGTAKTTLVFNLLLQLYGLGVPFLVLENVKTEYRILKTLRNSPDKNAHELAKALEIYTPGNENVSRHRQAPLRLKRGISVDGHIDNILNCFLAAMPVEGPLPALIGEALERVYDDHPHEDNPPLMADLVAATHQVLDEKRYSSETNSDIRTALEVRLGPLIRRNIGKIFQCRRSIPSTDHLMTVPAVIELNPLANDQKALQTLFILKDIREYLNTTPKPDRVPRYVIIIEEAHYTIGRSTEALPSPDIANPKLFAAEEISRMLLEFRGLGVAVFIIDQHPSLIAHEVMKATTTKIAFRQVDREDREALGGAMLFGPTEMEELARLKPGEAFFLTEGYHRSRKIRTENLYDRFNLKIDVLNEKILPYIKGDKWFHEAAQDRIISELTLLQEQMDRFDDERLKITEEFTTLLPRHRHALGRPDAPDTENRLANLKEKARNLAHRLRIAYQSFVKFSYKRYLDPSTPFDALDPLVQEMKEDLVQRFDTVIQPDVKNALERINSFIGRSDELGNKE